MSILYLTNSKMPRVQKNMRMNVTTGNYARAKVQMWTYYTFQKSHMFQIISHRLDRFDIIICLNKYIYIYSTALYTPQIETSDLICSTVTTSIKLTLFLLFLSQSMHKNETKRLLVNRMIHL